MKSKNSTPTLSVVLQYPDYFAFSIWDVTPSSVLEASQPNLPGKCDWAPSNAVGRDPAGSDGRSDCRSSDEAINRINRGLAAAKNGQRAHFGIRLGEQMSNIKAKAYNRKRCLLPSLGNQPGTDLDSTYVLFCPQLGLDES